MDSYSYWCYWPITIYSSDGTHLAFVTFNQQGTEGYDSASVHIRQSGRPFATVVFSGYGYTSPNFSNDTSTQIRWIDACHLHIHRRTLDVMRLALCETDKLDIRVTCEQNSEQN